LSVSVNSKWVVCKCKYVTMQVQIHCVCAWKYNASYLYMYASVNLHCELQVYMYASVNTLSSTSSVGEKLWCDQHTNSQTCPCSHQY